MPNNSKDEGLTPSQRYLSELCCKSFLSLWSYSNLQTERGRTDGRGGGHELCDLLVVFGDDIIVFSDKDIEFDPSKERLIAWKRWFNMTVRKSVDQLCGAERWLLKYQDRIYLDAHCKGGLCPPKNTSTIEYAGRAPRYKRLLKKIKIFILLLLLALPLSVLTGCGGADKANMSYMEAEELLGRGKFLLALDKYETVAREFEATPFAPKSLYKKALIYNRFLKDKRKAINSYYEVLSVYPKTDEAYSARLDLAAIYSAAGDHTKAVEQYQWILDSHREPQKAEDYRYIIALEYFKMSDFEQAGAELKELLATAGKEDVIAKALLLRGETFYITGNITEASATFEEIISRLPESPVAIEARFNLAKTLEDSDKEDEALAVLESLRDSYPNKDVLERSIKGVKTRMKEKKARRSRR